MRVSTARSEDLSRAWIGKPVKDLGIYVHIPFCVRKCLYCDFLSFGGMKRDVWERYVDSVCEEIRAWGRVLDGEQKECGESTLKSEDAECSYRVRSVFFGGGTPSLLDTDLFAKVMRTLTEVFKLEDKRVSYEADSEAGKVLNTEVEITVECNPGTVSCEKLQEYRRLGVNRISFGVQAADDTLLLRLGRIHTWDEFLVNYRAARDANFSNINVDLMSGLPGQSLADWKNTLEKVAALEPEHISAYSLIVEEGTPFFEWYGDCDSNSPCHPPLPDEDTEREMYEWTGSFLEKQGLKRYEISNYARMGFECRHNASYWRRTDYLGIGLGASSLFDGRRWHNTEVLEEYLAAANALEEDSADSGILKALRRDECVLSRKDAMEEFMFLGLRMCEGVKRTEFRNAFGVSMEEVYGEVIERLIRESLIKETDGGIALTERGIDVSNKVLAEFLLEDLLESDLSI